MADLLYRSELQSYFENKNLRPIQEAKQLTNGEYLLRLDRLVAKIGLNLAQVEHLRNHVSIVEGDLDKINTYFVNNIISTWTTLFQQLQFTNLHTIYISWICQNFIPNFSAEYLDENASMDDQFTYIQRVYPSTSLKTFNPYVEIISCPLSLILLPDNDVVVGSNHNHLPPKAILWNSGSWPNFTSLPMSQGYYLQHVSDHYQLEHVHQVLSFEKLILTYIDALKRTWLSLSHFIATDRVLGDRLVYTFRLTNLDASNLTDDQRLQLINIAMLANKTPLVSPTVLQSTSLSALYTIIKKRVDLHCVQHRGLNINKINLTPYVHDLLARSRTPFDESRIVIVAPQDFNIPQAIQRSVLIIDEFPNGTPVVGNNSLLQITLPNSRFVDVDMKYVFRHIHTAAYASDANFVLDRLTSQYLFNDSDKARDNAWNLKEIWDRYSSNYELKMPDNKKNVTLLTMLTSKNPINIQLLVKWVASDDGTLEAEVDYAEKATLTEIGDTPGYGFSILNYVLEVAIECVPLFQVPQDPGVISFLNTIGVNFINYPKDMTIYRKQLASMFSIHQIATTPNYPGIYVPAPTVEYNLRDGITVLNANMTEYDVDVLLDMTKDIYVRTSVLILVCSHYSIAQLTEFFNVLAIELGALDVYVTYGCHGIGPLNIVVTIAGVDTYGKVPYANTTLAGVATWLVNYSALDTITSVSPITDSFFPAVELKPETYASVGTRLRAKTSPVELDYYLSLITSYCPYTQVKRDPTPHSELYVLTGYISPNRLEFVDRVQAYRSSSITANDVLSLWPSSTANSFSRMTPEQLVTLTDHVIIYYMLKTAYEEGRLRNILIDYGAANLTGLHLAHLIYVAVDSVDFTDHGIPNVLFLNQKVDNTMDSLTPHNANVFSYNAILFSQVPDTDEDALVKWVDWMIGYDGDEERVIIFNFPYIDDLTLAGAHFFNIFIKDGVAFIKLGDYAPVAMYDSEQYQALKKKYTLQEINPTVLDYHKTLGFMNQRASDTIILDALTIHRFIKTVMITLTPS